MPQVTWFLQFNHLNGEKELMEFVHEDEARESFGKFASTDCSDIYSSVTLFSTDWKTGTDTIHATLTF